jgi:hypothetical protein
MISNKNGSLGRWLRSPSFEGRVAGSEPWNRVFQIWGPIVAVVLIVTARPTLLHTVARILLALVVVLEVIRFRGYFAFLNLWIGRVLIYCVLWMATALWCAAVDPRLLVILPAVVGITIFYLHYQFAKWKQEMVG